MPRRNALGPKPRPSRRRIATLVLVALIVILLIAEVINDTEKQAPAVGRRLASSWVAGLEPMLARSYSVASVIAHIERNPSAQTFASTDASISAAEVLLTDAKDSLAALDLAPPSATTSRLAADVLTSRVAALGSLQQMLSTAARGEPGPAVAACLDLQRTVRLGDAALIDLAADLKRSQAGSVQTFRPWGLVLPRLASPGCGSLVAALGANSSLRAHLALRFAAISVEPNAVQINGVPNPTSTTTTTLAKSGQTTTTSTSTTSIVSNSGTTTTSTSTSTSTSTTLPPVTTTTLQIPPLASRSVLPPTGTITVQVVLQDSGNQSLGDVRVSVQLASSQAAVPPLRTRDVGTMTAGSARDLTFGPIPLNKISGSFELHVSATASNLVRVTSTITLVRSPH